MATSGRPLTPQDENRIRKLRAETDLSIAKIAKEQRCSETTVKKILATAIAK